MGSYVEINDTLQITKEQGFPKELKLEEHLKNPYVAEDFKDKIFEFKDKPSIRNYQMPPVRNFLAENIDGKWLYWGQIHMYALSESTSFLGQFKRKIPPPFKSESISNRER